MTSFVKQLKPQSSPGFSRRTDELRTELKHIPAEVLAARTGSVFSPVGSEGGEFRFQFNRQSVSGTYPDMVFHSSEGKELPEFQQLELLYYFVTSDGIPLTGKYVSFADLPGGRMYAQAFQGYSGNEVVKVFDENIEAFKAACELANGQPAGIADAAYVFQVLPRVAVQLVYWLGDEDFPSSCKILFDAAATHYLTIDGCAIIGSSVAHRIIKNNPAK